MTNAYILRQNSLTFTFSLSWNFPALLGKNYNITKLSIFMQDNSSCNDLKLLKLFWQYLADIAPNFATTFLMRLTETIINFNEALCTGNHL